jgi:hypothetical protein
VSPVSMVASAGNAISQNPSRPSQKPYTLPSKLRPEFTWMLPEDGLSFEDRLKEYVSKKELQVQFVGRMRVSTLIDHLNDCRRAMASLSRTGG